jgi:hypothetical protein
VVGGAAALTVGGGDGDDRFNLQLNVPYSASSGGVYQGTPQSNSFYAFRTDGMGDLTVEGEYWLTDPKKPTRVQGSVGLGLKSDTGSTDETGTVFTPGGDAEGFVAWWSGRAR